MANRALPPPNVELHIYDFLRPKQSSPEVNLGPNILSLFVIKEFITFYCKNWAGQSFLRPLINI